MRIKTSLTALAFAAAALGALAPVNSAEAASWSWFGGERVQGNGKIQTQKREVGHFSGVSSALAGHVEVRVGASEGVSIETDENLQPLIETVIENGVLKLRPNKKNLNLSTRTMKIVVDAKTLDSLTLGGAGSIDADALKGNKVRVELGGSGTVQVKQAQADSVSVSVGGSGKVKIGGGDTAKLSISIGGSGDLDAPSLKARAVSVSIGGSGEATVTALDSLDVSIAGSGDVNYYGDPRVNRSVVGSGSAKRLGPAQ